PSEKRIERLILSMLAEGHEATLDEIYQGLYLNLVNGMTPDTSQVDRVLNSLAERVPGTSRANWRHRTQVSLFGEQLGPKVKREKSASSLQTRLGGESPLETEDENSLHDQTIKRLAEIGFERGYDVHIGATEQRK